LFPLRHSGPTSFVSKESQVFLVLFFQKKNRFLPTTPSPISTPMSTNHAAGGLAGFLRNPGLFLYTLRRGTRVGQDDLGNIYYERPGRFAGARNRRWVVYAGPADASVIGPEWHAWLHHLTDEPLPAPTGKPWVKPHEPNRTGTPQSYRPAGHDYQGGKRASASADYQAWTPDGEA
jgi:NADH:ubiquinone oxidoreductase subunit